MGLVLTFLCILMAYGTARRSLGRGLGVVLAIGCFYGIVRGQFPDGFSHFMFDGALLGLYLARFTRTPTIEETLRSRGVRSWVMVLAVWPVITIPLSLALPSSQNVLIQVVGLRAAVLFLPLLILGARLTEEDLDILHRWAFALTFIAFGFAALELQLGLEPFFPHNSTTELIYISTAEFGGERYNRIPATFSSAHAYAGTMVSLLPLLLWRPRNRGTLAWLAVLAVAVLGIFASAARTPVVHVGVMLALLVLTTRVPPRWLAGLLVLGVAIAYVVASNPRFQRFETLQDTEYVRTRVGWSLNLSLLEVITDYPMGAGLGSASGTSIPFFLTDLMQPQIGLENDFSRISLEQGVIGLLLWVAFVFWAVWRWPTAPPARLAATRLMWILTIVYWATALIGTGLLTSIPPTMLLMLQMGRVAALDRARPAAAPAFRRPQVASRVAA